MAATAEHEEVLDYRIRGHHVFKEVWTPTQGETLVCASEFGNIHDPYAVAVQNASITGFILLLATFHDPSPPFVIVFIRRNGPLTCQVTGPRRYSADLSQGGLEVPCSYTFSTHSSKE